MPRLPTLHLPALADLLQQLRFAPRATRLRQMHNAEELAAEIRPGQSYPHDFIVFRLTGYRPEGEDNPVVYEGETLRAELGVFVELLCDTLNLSRDELEEESYTTAELQELWSVSVRTISRYRRQGLIAYRVIDRGRRRLIFPGHQVERFAAGRSKELAEAKSFSRIDEELAKKMIRRAGRYHDTLGYSLNRAAKRLARRFNRGHETVRKLLARHDASAGGNAIFIEPGPLSAKQREAIFRAWRRGVKAERIAAHYRRSRSSVHRAINEQRLIVLQRQDLSGPETAMFSREDAASVILAPAPVRSDLLTERVENLAQFIREAEKNELPEAEEEQVLCTARVFLLYQARQALAELPRQQPSALVLDRVETNLRWATRLKEKLIAHHLKLALDTVEDFMGREITELPGNTARELCTLMVETLSEAVDRHDVFKGGRLAAPVSLGLARALGRSFDRPHAGLAKMHGSGETIGLPDLRGKLDDWQQWLDLPLYLRDRFHRLNAEEKQVINLRYGLTGENPRTAEETALQLDMARITVLRRERQAVSRLYRTVDEDDE